MKQIFETVAKQLIGLYGIEHIAIYQLDPSGTKLNLQSSFGFSGESLQSLTNLKTDSGILKRLIESRIPQVVNDIRQTEEGLSFLAEIEGLTSSIAVPILLSGKMWGILMAFSQEPFRFKQEDARVINLFTGQLGELAEIFSRRLGDNLDELLVRLLGSIELMSFKFKDKDMIPVSEILAEQNRLKERVLSLLTDTEQQPLNLQTRHISEQVPKIVLPSGDELEIEEVVTIKGEKDVAVKTKKVLVIDDQPIVTDLLVSVLERMEYKSQVASSGRSGLELFAKDEFDLVITDLGMLDVSGWDVSKAVKTKKPHIPVLVITGWGIDPDPNKMKESKVDLIIHKPFQIDELEKIIRKFLEK